MYGQSSYGRSGNGSRMQNRYQTQRNYNHSENISNRMEEQQNSDPQQDYVNEQPAPRPPQAPQDSQFSCQVIQPDPVKREKLLTMRRKEEEDYESFKNSRRSGPIHLTPKKLGGETSELEVREQQQQIQAQSKYQKMMKREEYKKKLKEEEEAKIQKMKDLQRQKAEKLQQKRQQQDLEREQRWHEDRWRRNNTFLDQFDSESHHYDRRFGQPSEWVDNQEYSDDWEQPNNLSHEMTVKQEEDEDWMLQQAMKNSLLMHKTEKDIKLEEVKNSPHKPSNHHTYRQQQKEQEDRRLQEMKNEQRKKAEVLEQQEKERTLSQEEERRRVNNAFLDRFQRQSTSQHRYKGESNTWD